MNIFITVPSAMNVYLCSNKVVIGSKKWTNGCSSCAAPSRL